MTTPTKADEGDDDRIVIARGVNLGIDAKATVDVLAQMLFEKGVLDADDMNDLIQDGGTADNVRKRYLSEL
jgi:hypothetical protein